MYKILNKTYSKLPTEDTEQEELVKWLIKNNYFFFATKNENNQSFNNRLVAIKIEAKAKARGKIKGTPDLCIFTDNKIVFMELKRQKPILKSGKLGKPTNDATKEQLNKIRSFGKLRPIIKQCTAWNTKKVTQEKLRGIIQLKLIR